MVVRPFLTNYPNDCALVAVKHEVKAQTGSRSLAEDECMSSIYRRKFWADAT